MNKEIFIKRLKEARENQNLTQEQLSKATTELIDIPGKQVTRSSIARYESGVRTPPIEILVPMAVILKIDVDYLLGLTDKKHQHFKDEQLTRFLNKLSKITSLDNYEENEKISSILQDISAILEISYDNQLLDVSSNIFSSLASVYYLKYNSDKLKNTHDNVLSVISNHLKTIEEEMDDYMIDQGVISLITKMNIIEGVTNKLDNNDISSISDIELDLLKKYNEIVPNNSIPEELKKIFNSKNE